MSHESVRETMSQMVGSLFFVGFLFLGMLVMLEVGRRVRSRQRDLHVEEAEPGLGAVEGAVFALMGTSSWISSSRDWA